MKSKIVTVLFMLLFITSLNACMNGNKNTKKNDSGPALTNILKK
ncbi:MAG: hypothetical protein OEZ58_06070 [Gammaproteobacteria bacterium]|nr:hypothetical protein [Gammaproteobacteria bacterium]MDH5728535.1 hypothetical protein [Gammaproteobacteria bacterium]